MSSYSLAVVSRFTSPDAEPANQGSSLIKGIADFQNGLLNLSFGRYYSCIYVDIRPSSLSSYSLFHEGSPLANLSFVARNTQTGKENNVDFTGYNVDGFLDEKEPFKFSSHIHLEPGEYEITFREKSIS